MIGPKCSSNPLYFAHIDSLVPHRNEQTALSENYSATVSRN